MCTPGRFFFLGQYEPIPGLYAIPPTAGGIMRSIHTGMIGCAGAFGLIGAKHAAAFAKGKV
jgi:hypothetical protein